MSRRKQSCRPTAEHPDSRQKPASRTAVPSWSSRTCMRRAVAGVHKNRVCEIRYGRCAREKQRPDPAGRPWIKPESRVRQMHAPLVFDGNHSASGYLPLATGREKQGECQAERKKPKPISTRKSERNCPRVNGPVSGASGSRKSFANHPQDRIANEKDAGQNAIAQLKPCAQNPKDREEQETFKRGLIKLRRMPRRQRSRRAAPSGLESGAHFRSRPRC